MLYILNALMKILHINSYYIAAPFYKNLYDLQNKEFEISVYIPISEKYAHVDKYFGKYSEKSVVFREQDRPFFFRKHRKILEDIESKYSIESYDLIHAHSLFSNGYIAYELNKKYGIPYVVAVRNTDVNIFFKKMLHLRKLGKEILENASKVVYISEPYRELVLKKYMKQNKNYSVEKTVVIPNGIDQYWIDNLNKNRKELDLSRGLNILSVGDVEKNKNQSKTAIACKKLEAKYGKVKFNVVGRKNDKRFYKKLEKNSFFEYYGTKNKNDLIDIYRENDIFVMPSKTETFGIVYAEAMSQGLPIIYTEHQGFDGQFEEGVVGYHVNSEDENDIVKKIEMIIKNYDFLSKKCIEKVHKFKWENIVNIYSDIYDDIVRRK